MSGVESELCAMTPVVSSKCTKRQSVVFLIWLQKELSKSP